MRTKKEQAPPELFEKQVVLLYFSFSVLRLQKPKVSKHGLILLELPLEKSTWKLHTVQFRRDSLVS